MKKTILITGASSGIGKAIARYFNDKNWNVAATMRSPEKEEELPQLTNTRCYALDVNDTESIEKACEQVINDFGGIDVIVNNAGFGAVGIFEASSDEDVKKQFETNVFGLMRVTRKILPYFRKVKKGMFINIASMGGRLTFPLYSLYHGTKWAVEGFSESLHYELKQFNIKVKIIEPGAIKTDFYERSQNLMTKEGLTAYDEYVNTVYPATQEAGKKAPGPDVVAKKVYRAATDGSNKMRYPVGSGAPMYLFLRRLLPDSWYFKLVRMNLE